MSIGQFQNRSESSQLPSEAVEDLLQRLEELCPREMAQALCTLEFHEHLAKKSASFNPHSPGETSIYFSRGLKQEIQGIYLELAKHLKAQNRDAHKLMDRVFEFFEQTMKFMVQSPLMVSSN
ncbi:MAG TPA: hypothetical protein VJR29_02910 [bacterium]|nr:hypothetical protein [bacterium]